MNRGATTPWVMVKLSDVCNIISGKNQSRVANPSGRYPIYGSGGIIGYADDFLCEPGTTIIGRKGTINSPIYVRTQFWNVDTAFGFSPNSSLESRFLYFFCEFFNFKKLDKSTAVPSLAKRDLLNIDFPLPPLPEQRAIVAKIEQLFSELDNGIANLKTAQAQLKVYRQAVLKKAFEGELTFSEMSKVSFKELMSEKPQNGLYKPSSEYGSGVKILRIDGFYDGDILSNYEYKRVRINNSDIQKYSIAPGDILINRVNSMSHLGKCGLVKKVDEPIVFESNIMKVSIDKSKANPVYLKYYLSSIRGISELRKNAKQAVNQASINQKDVGNVRISFCSLAIQERIIREIESRLSVCDKIEESIRESLTKAEALRQSILKKAFEGNLLTEAELAACRKEPDWEPAENVLEKF